MIQIISFMVTYSGHHACNTGIQRIKCEKRKKTARPRVCVTTQAQPVLKAESQVFPPPWQEFPGNLGKSPLSSGLTKHGTGWDYLAFMLSLPDSECLGFFLENLL